MDLKSRCRAGPSRSEFELSIRFTAYGQTFLPILTMMIGTKLISTNIPGRSGSVTSHPYTKALGVCGLWPSESLRALHLVSSSFARSISGTIFVIRMSSSYMELAVLLVAHLGSLSVRIIRMEAWRPG